MLSTTHRLRAVDFHRKEDQLKKMKEKAALKNPDEFYFNMVRTKQAPPPSRRARMPACRARMPYRRRVACRGRVSMRPTACGMRTLRESHATCRGDDESHAADSG